MRTIEPTFNPGDETVLQEWSYDKYPPGTKVKVIKDDHSRAPYLLKYPDGEEHWEEASSLHPRFKVGDRVKVVSERPKTCNVLNWNPIMDGHLGTEATITGVFEGPNGVWRYSIRWLIWDFLADWLEIVKEVEEPEAKPAAPEKPSPSFKVGDKVRVIDTPPSDRDIAGRANWYPYKDKTCGCTGTIAAIDLDGDIRVAFEHNLWWYRPEWLRPAEEKSTLSRAIKETASLVASAFKGKEDAPQPTVPLIRKNKFLTQIKLD